MFCFGAQAYLDALRTCAPDLYAGVSACWDETDRTNPEKLDFPPAHFAQLSDISIDYAVMEKHPDVAVVRAEFPWNDVGSWSALGDLTAPDADGNRIAGEAIMAARVTVTFRATPGWLRAIGLEDLIVVDTPDALLVTHKGRVQDVKQVVCAPQAQQSRRPSKCIAPRTGPWGTYTVLEDGTGSTRSSASS